MGPICLSEIAHGRSGDKGNHANVAVLAYTPAGYDWLRAHLTADVVQQYFAPLGRRGPCAMKRKTCWR